MHTEEIWHDSPEIFLESIGAIEKKFPGSAASAVLANALQAGIGLSSTDANVFAAALERWVMYFLHQEPLVPVEQGDMIRAVRAVNELVGVNYNYDMDYLAGYAEHDAKRIYIDRDFSRKDMEPYLVVHEVVEKCLLDFVKFDEHQYAYAHQVAQRIEESATAAAGIAWSLYQNEIMEPEIERVSKKRISRIPPDLDLTPHHESKDTDIVAIEKLKRDSLFSVSKYGEDIYHLTFTKPDVMAHTLMRFQEYYESPKFRGQFFTRDEFIEWYSVEQKGAQYIEDWGMYGFNFPGSVLEQFYAGKFDPLSQDEMDVLDYFKGVKNNFYVIATSLESSGEMIGHEIAHALYFLNPDYRSEVESILSNQNVEPLKKFLTTHPEYGNYHAAVLDDEVHAYLSQTTKELEQMGFDLQPYTTVIEQLQQVYKRFAPKMRGE